MNVDGSQMIKGLHYEETYAPVVQWATIRFFISLAILSNWHTRQLDFVLAYTQADIERDLYMKLPAFEIHSFNNISNTLLKETIVAQSIEVLEYVFEDMKDFLNDTDAIHSVFGSKCTKDQANRLADE